MIILPWHDESAHAISGVKLCSVQIVVKFPVWRWLFFFAFTFPIFLICRGVMRCIVLLLENSFFDTKQTLYYLIGIKVKLPIPYLFPVMTSAK